MPVASRDFHTKCTGIRRTIVAIGVITFPLPAVIAISVIEEKTVIAYPTWNDVLKTPSTAEQDLESSGIRRYHGPVLSVSVEIRRPSKPDRVFTNESP
jgi:hypothetical protein